MNAEPPEKRRRVHSTDYTTNYNSNFNNNTTIREQRRDVLANKRFQFNMEKGVYDYGGKHSYSKKFKTLPVNVNSDSEFKNIIWNTYNKYLKGYPTTEEREVNGRTINKAIIDEEREFTLETCETRFFKVWDKKQKRGFPLSSTSSHQLDLWTKRNHAELELKVYPYGYDINKITFNELEAAQHTAESDRAGAEKERSLTETVNFLKAKLEQYLAGKNEMAWRIWAQNVLASDRSISSEESPPETIIHLFTAIPNQFFDSETNNRTRSNRMAMDCLGSLEKSLSEMITTIKNFKKCLEHDSSYVGEIYDSYG